MRRPKSFLGQIVPAIVLASLGVMLAASPAAAKVDEKAWAQARKDLEQSIAAGEPGAIVAAVEAVAADNSRRAADLLLAVGVSDKLSSPRVYDAVLAGLSGMHDEDVQEYLVESLGRKTEGRLWSIRCVLCDVLATARRSDATAALAARLKDDVAYVVSAAAKALGRRKDRAAMDPLIRALADLDKKRDVAWLDIRGALTAITGYDFETPSERDAFWASKRDSFDPEKDRGQKAAPTTEAREGTTFFTEVIVSKRIMFVLDISGSMREKDIPIEEGGSTQRRGPGPKATRIDVAKKALIACIKDLKSDVKFNVIAFSTDFKAWRPSKQGLTSAESAARADAIRWVQALEADGATETDRALEESFANTDVNTIVLLSDGQPTRANRPAGGGPGGGPGGGGGGRGRGFGGEEIDPQEILDKVKVWNRLRGVKIHTFCFKVFDELSPSRGFDPQKCLDFLKNLAEENGGKLTKV